MTADPLDTLIPGLDVSVRRVRDIMREVATSEILTRYRQLSDGQIGEKRPGEVVTDADIAAERALESRLSDLVEGCLIISEEGVEEAPDLMTRLDENIPTFILDPVDGTQNFANGEDCFAVIVAYRYAGETLAGWIHDPLADVTCWAAKGAGTHFDHGGATSGATDRSILHLRGCLGMKARSALAKKDTTAKPELMPRYRCVGREYFDLCAGRLDFVQFGQRLKPWDHAAGDLISREAGFTSLMVESAEPYKPSDDGIAYGNLLIAPEQTTWQELASLIS